jgi:LysR family transcriptional regulator (chromosome initiation inhibitor)
VQGCTSALLGSLRYRAVAAPHFAEHWFRGAGPGAIADAPVVEFDPDDAMQREWAVAIAGREPVGPRFRVPEVDGITRAVAAGLGWSLVPALLADPAIAAGQLVDLSPGRTAGTTLRWQRWAVPSKALDGLSAAVHRVAAERLLRP